MAESINWPALIGHAILIRRDLGRLDPEQLGPDTLPRIKARPEEIATFERKFGEPLPTEYHELLLHANGWPQFFFAFDLFGLPELYGEGSWSIGLDALEVYESEGVLEDLGFNPGDVIPIGAGPGMPGLYLLVRSGRPQQGQVSWIDGEEIDRYAGCAEFLASITAYQKQRLEKLVSDGG